MHTLIEIVRAFDAERTDDRFTTRLERARQLQGNGIIRATEPGRGGVAARFATAEVIAMVTVLAMTESGNSRAAVDAMLTDLHPTAHPGRGSAFAAEAEAIARGEMRYMVAIVRNGPGVDWPSVEYHLTDRLKALAIVEHEGADPATLQVSLTPITPLAVPVLTRLAALDA